MADVYQNLYNPDVLSCLANLSNDEVFTPPEVANRMLDLLPQELSYSVMAQQCFISETAAKYRVKKMQKLCGAYNREELTELIRNIL